MQNFVSRFWLDETGATAIEYGLIARDSGSYHLDFENYRDRSQRKIKTIDNGLK